MALVERELSALEVTAERTRKGALHWSVPGQPGGKQVTFSAHVDTLGAMVKTVKPNGRLSLAQLGGYDWTSIEGEYVRVHTLAGRALTGTVVNVQQSTHVRGQELRDLKRDAQILEVRLDEVTASAGETHALGVGVGDFVSFEPRADLTPAGDLKSRHLDNKAAVAVFVAVTQVLQTAATGRPPAFPKAPTC